MDNKKRENKLREKQIKAEKNKKILSKEELERREKIKKINDEFKIKKSNHKRKRNLEIFF